MEIMVNGKPLQVPESMTVSALLESLELAGKRLAVELNREIVPRSQHASHQLKDSDRIEIVHAIGGG